MNKMRYNQVGPQGGFIALISAIIIASLLISITVALNLSGFFGRFNILDSELKEVSLSLAEACADTAILKLQGDMNYTPPAPPGEVVLVGTDQCTIWSVSTGAFPKTIKTQARYPQSGKSAYTNLKVVVSEPGSEIVVNSWEEIPSLP